MITSTTSFVGQNANVWPDPGSGDMGQQAAPKMDREGKANLQYRIDGLLELGQIGHLGVRLRARDWGLPTRDMSIRPEITQQKISETHREGSSCRHWLVVVMLRCNNWDQILIYIRTTSWMYRNGMRDPVCCNIGLLILLPLSVPAILYLSVYRAKPNSTLGLSCPSGYIKASSRTGRVEILNGETDISGNPDLRGYAAPPSANDAIISLLNINDPAGSV